VRRCPRVPIRSRRRSTPARNVKFQGRLFQRGPLCRECGSQFIVYQRCCLRQLSLCSLRPPRPVCYAWKPGERRAWTRDRRPFSTPASSSPASGLSADKKVRDPAAWISSRVRRRVQKAYESRPIRFIRFSISPKMSTPTPGTPTITPAAAPSPAIPQGAGTPLPPAAPSRQAPGATASSSGTGTFGVRTAVPAGGERRALC
jgi:hypothetical protein